MTETQAKSGAAGTPTAPVDEEAAKSGAPATGRAAVGRATVPGDTPSPKFTRAPGMAPPPDQPADQGASMAPSDDGGPAGGAGQGHVLMTKAPADAGGDGARGGQAGTATRPAAAGQGRLAAGGTAIRTSGIGAAPGSTGQATAGGNGAGGPGAVGAARVTEAVRAARNTVGSAASRGPRRARLNVKRIDPWSVMKFSFAVSLVLFIVVIVATSVLYLALDAMGVFGTVNTSLGELINAGGGQDSGGFQITAKGVIGTSALIGLVNVVLFTALATLAAFVYNVCADLVGGVELTLAERD
ncbi:DUF3566 domain-containing protein [Polymorphospora rubra]|uniref:DUF3566 domain-containing protein n=1 Tax=Polymorphospora rubra TaxID=338584 RepID=A0A810N109_9ACTN|nr:DUF3566 domain-containing protein [Polymorphospora rubra]BCJ65463.1 hypothetical protein Prubr_24840 [Polymorphospora rubra]